MKILVCGGRMFGEDCSCRHGCNGARIEQKLLYNSLDDIHKNTPITMVINGGASGADKLAREWADRRGVDHKEYYAEWNSYGKSAGPIRNCLMLYDNPDIELVVATQGGSGTLNMVKLSRSAQIRVVEL